MSAIDCAFFGFLSADAEPRTSQAGKPWVRLNVGVGRDEAIQWVSVAVFGKAAEDVADLKKADRVYVEGTIKLNSWRTVDNVERYGLSVAAFKCERTHAIGRNKPKRKADSAQRASSRSNLPQGAAFNDDIGF